MLQREHDASVSALLTLVRDVQVPVVALLLLVGGAVKLVAFVPRAVGGSEAGVLGPALLLDPRWRRPVTLGVAVAELTICGGLVFAPGRAADLARLAATVLFGIGMLTLGELRKRHPDAGCGCFGTVSRTPVSLRSVLRSGLLAVAAASTVGLVGRGAERIIDISAGHLGLGAAELVLLIALSPEVGLLVRGVTRREPCETRRVPVARTLAALRGSPRWRAHRDLLTAERPRDIWRELCWRYVVYPGELEHRPVDVVFAVRLGDKHPDVRVAVVDRETGRTCSVEPSSHI